MVRFLPFSLIATVFRPFASLRLTVALFGMGIFIVLVGTLAQVEKDMWDVINDYFRAKISWIEFKVLFPRSFFPRMPQIPGGFFFPGGWTIGFLLMLNLLAAHLVGQFNGVCGLLLTGELVAELAFAGADGAVS